jgi:hypothetical protein
MSSYSPLFRQGRYLGRVVSQKLGQARTGTYQLRVTFYILDASCGRQFKNVYLYLTPRARNLTLAALRTLGLTIDVKDIDWYTLEHCCFTGRECELECRHGRYEGRWREQWSIVTPRMRNGAQQFDATDARTTN